MSTSMCAVAWPRPGLRGLLALSLIWGCIIVADSRAFAHGSRPVYSLLDADESGALAVCLSQGLAARQGQAWRFICPTMFQGTQQDPCDAMPGGGVVVGMSGGIATMKRDGTIAPHPDPNAAGHIIAFASSNDALYALRQRDVLYDVIAVGPDRVSVILSGTRTFSDLGMGQDFLQLVRDEPTQVEQLLIGFDGTLLSDLKAPLSDVFSVNARPVGSTSYFLAGVGSSDYQLGRVEEGKWNVLAEAGGNLAGPIATADGARFLALEGKLGRFDADAFTPMEGGTDFVTCLRQLRDRTYACTFTGVRELTGAGLGATLFDLSMLYPPDLTKLSGEPRTRCNLEWEHFRVELKGMNIAVADPTSAPSVMSSGGGPATIAPGATAGAAGASGGAGMSAPPAPASGSTAASGCAVSSQVDGGSSVTLLLILFGVTVLVRGRAGRPD